MKESMKQSKSLRVTGLSGLAGLLLALSLTACGDASTAVSQGGTAAAGAATAAGTALAGGAKTAGTAAAGALTQAPTVVSGALTQAPTVAASGGTAVAGASGTAGTVVSGALTPVTTPTAAGATGTLPTASSTVSGAATTGATGLLPVYTGAQPVTLSASEQSQVIQGLDLVRTIVNQPTINFYKLSGSAATTSGQTQANMMVSDFYKKELSTQGWTDRTSQLSALLQGGTIEFMKNKPQVFTKGDQVAFIGVTAPMTSEAINTAGLSGKFNPGDIGIMTLTGVPTIRFQ